MLQHGCATGLDVWELLNEVGADTIELFQVKEVAQRATYVQVQQW